MASLWPVCGALLPPPVLAAGQQRAHSYASQAFAQGWVRRVSRQRGMHAPCLYATCGARSSATPAPLPPHRRTVAFRQHRNNRIRGGRWGLGEAQPEKHRLPRIGSNRSHMHASALYSEAPPHLEVARHGLCRKVGQAVAVLALPLVLGAGPGGARGGADGGWGGGLVGGCTGGRVGVHLPEITSAKQSTAARRAHSAAPCAVPRRAARPQRGAGAARGGAGGGLVKLSSNPCVRFVPPRPPPTHAHPVLSFLYSPYPETETHMNSMHGPSAPSLRTHCNHPPSQCICCPHQADVTAALT